MLGTQHNDIRLCRFIVQILSVQVAEPEGFSDKQRKKKSGEVPKFAAAPQVPLKRPRSNPATGDISPAKPVSRDCLAL